MFICMPSGMRSSMNGLVFYQINLYGLFRVFLSFWINIGIIIAPIGNDSEKELDDMDTIQFKLYERMVANFVNLFILWVEVGNLH